MRRSHSSARDNYNRLARWYDLISGNTEWRHVKNGIDILDVQPDWRVLEVGFGTGKSLVYLNEHINRQGVIIGIDISEKMAGKAKDRINKQVADPNIFLTIGDAVKLPFRNNFFDAICMSFTLELFDKADINDLLSECKRVLKPNARMLVVGMHEGYSHRLIVKIYRLAQNWFPNVVDCRPLYISEELLQSGFRINSVNESSIWGLPIEVIMGQNN